MNNLKKIILDASLILQPKIPWADAKAILGALAEVESAFGVYNVPKHERAFDVYGKFFNRGLWVQYGAWAACSYSSFQLMFTVAVELGFPGRPQDLWEDQTAIHWVLSYIDKRILSRGCTNIRDFSDAYNSGSFTDRYVPEEYVHKFEESYRTVVERRGLT